MAGIRGVGPGIGSSVADHIMESPGKSKVDVYEVDPSSGALIQRYCQAMKGNGRFGLIDVQLSADAEVLDALRSMMASADLEWGSEVETDHSLGETDHRDGPFPSPWRADLDARYAGFGNSVMALATCLFRSRLLLMLAFICMASAHPVGNTWSDEHGLPPAEITEQGLLWLWHILRPLLPIPINIAGLVWSAILLRKRIKTGAPCGTFSMLFFFVTISGPVTMAVYYGTSVPDGRDLAVMTAVCLFFAYPFATHLGCLLDHNVRIYTAYVLSLVLICLLIIPTMGRRIRDKEARQLLNVLQAPLLILLAWLGFQVAHLCVLQNPFRDCSLSSPIRGLRRTVRQQQQPAVATQEENFAGVEIPLRDRSHVAS